MRLACRLEGGLDAHVQLLRADLEPDAAARLQQHRLLDLLEPEQLAEERTRVVLATGGGGELNVFDPGQHGVGGYRRGYARGYIRRGMVLPSRPS
jgi:hypothetical protein